ncbi:hypothetical protein BVX93_00720, partial [bacterium B13(2017)]
SRAAYLQHFRNRVERLFSMIENRRLPVNYSVFLEEWLNPQVEEYRQFLDYLGEEAEEAFNERLNDLTERLSNEATSSQDEVVSRRFNEANLRSLGTLEEINTYLSDIRLILRENRHYLTEVQLGNLESLLETGRQLVTHRESQRDRFVEEFNERLETYERRLRSAISAERIRVLISNLEQIQVQFEENRRNLTETQVEELQTRITRLIFFTQEQIGDIVAHYMWDPERPEGRRRQRRAIRPEMARIIRRSIEFDEFVLLDAEMMRFYISDENIFQRLRVANAENVFEWIQDAIVDMRNEEAQNRLLRVLSELFTAEELTSSERVLSPGRIIELLEELQERVQEESLDAQIEVMRVRMRAIAQESEQEEVVAPEEQEEEESIISEVSQEEFIEALIPENLEDSEDELENAYQRLRTGNAIDERQRNLLALEEGELRARRVELEGDLTGRTHWRTEIGANVSVGNTIGVYACAFLNFEIQFPSESDERLAELRNQYVELRNEILEIEMQVRANHLYYEYLASVNRMYEILHNQDRLPIDTFYSELAEARTAWEINLRRLPISLQAELMEELERRDFYQVDMERELRRMSERVIVSSDLRRDLNFRARRLMVELARQNLDVSLNRGRMLSLGLSTDIIQMVFQNVFGLIAFAIRPGVDQTEADSRIASVIDNRGEFYEWMSRHEADEDTLENAYVEQVARINNLRQRQEQLITRIQEIETGYSEANEEEERSESRVAGIRRTLQELQREYQRLLRSLSQQERVLVNLRSRFLAMGLELPRDLDTRIAQVSSSRFMSDEGLIEDINRMIEGSRVRILHDSPQTGDRREVSGDGSGRQIFGYTYTPGGIHYDPEGGWDQEDARGNFEQSIQIVETMGHNVRYDGNQGIITEGFGGTRFADPAIEEMNYGLSGRHDFDTTRDDEDDQDMQVREDVQLIIDSDGQMKYAIGAGLRDTARGYVLDSGVIINDDGSIDNVFLNGRVVLLDDAMDLNFYISNEDVRIGIRYSEDRWFIDTDYFYRFADGVDTGVNVYGQVRISETLTTRLGLEFSRDEQGVYALVPSGELQALIGSSRISLRQDAVFEDFETEELATTIDTSTQLDGNHRLVSSLRLINRQVEDSERRSMGVEGTVGIERSFGGNVIIISTGVSYDEEEGFNFDEIQVGYQHDSGFGAEVYWNQDGSVTSGHSSVFGGRLKVPVGDTLEVDLEGMVGIGNSTDSGFNLRVMWGPNLRSGASSAEWSIPSLSEMNRGEVGAALGRNGLGSDVTSGVGRSTSALSQTGTRVDSRSGNIIGEYTTSLHRLSVREINTLPHDLQNLIIESRTVSRTDFQNVTDRMEDFIETSEELWSQYNEISAETNRALENYERQSGRIEEIRTQIRELETTWTRHRELRQEIVDERSATLVEVEAYVRDMITLQEQLRELNDNIRELQRNFEDIIRSVEEDTQENIQELTESLNEWMRWIQEVQGELSEVFQDVEEYQRTFERASRIERDRSTAFASQIDGLQDTWDQTIRRIARTSGRTIGFLGMGGFCERVERNAREVTADAEIPDSSSERFIEIREIISRFESNIEIATRMAQYWVQIIEEDRNEDEFFQEVVSFLETVAEIINDTQFERYLGEDVDLSNADHMSLLYYWVAVAQEENISFVRSAMQNRVALISHIRRIIPDFNVLEQNHAELLSIFADMATYDSSVEIENIVSLLQTIRIYKDQVQDYLDRSDSLDLLDASDREILIEWATYLQQFDSNDERFRFLSHLIILRPAYVALRNRHSSRSAREFIDSYLSSPLSEEASNIISQVRMVLDDTTTRFSAERVQMILENQEQLYPLVMELLDTNEIEFNHVLLLFGGFARMDEHFGENAVRIFERAIELRSNLTDNILTEFFGGELNLDNSEDINTLFTFAGITLRYAEMETVVNRLETAARLKPIIEENYGFGLELDQEVDARVLWNWTMATERYGIDRVEAVLELINSETREIIHRNSSVNYNNETLLNLFQEFHQNEPLAWVVVEFLEERFETIEDARDGLSELLLVHNEIQDIFSDRPSLNNTNYFSYLRRIMQMQTISRDSDYREVRDILGDRRIDAAELSTRLALIFNEGIIELLRVGGISSSDIRNLNEDGFSATEIGRVIRRVEMLALHLLMNENISDQRAFLNRFREMYEYRGEWEWLGEGYRMDSLVDDVDFEILLQLANLMDENIETILSYMSDNRESIVTSLGIDLNNIRNDRELRDLFIGTTLEHHRLYENAPVGDITAHLNELYNASGEITWQTHRELIDSWSNFHQREIDGEEFNSIEYLEAMVSIRSDFEDAFLNGEDFNQEHIGTEVESLLDLFTWMQINGDEEVSVESLMRVTGELLQGETLNQIAEILGVEPSEVNIFENSWHREVVLFDLAIKALVLEQDNIEKIIEEMANLSNVFSEHREDFLQGDSRAEDYEALFLAAVMGGVLEEDVSERVRQWQENRADIWDRVAGSSINNLFSAYGMEGAEFDIRNPGHRRVADLFGIWFQGREQDAIEFLSNSSISGVIRDRLFGGRALNLSTGDSADYNQLILLAKKQQMENKSNAEMIELINNMMMVFSWQMASYLNPASNAYLDLRASLPLRRANTPMAMMSRAAFPDPQQSIDPFGFTPGTIDPSISIPSIPDGSTMVPMILRIELADPDLSGVEGRIAWLATNDAAVEMINEMFFPGSLSSVIGGADGRIPRRGDYGTEEEWLDALEVLEEGNAGYDVLEYLATAYHQAGLYDDSVTGTAPIQSLLEQMHRVYSDTNFAYITRHEFETGARDYSTLDLFQEGLEDWQKSRERMFTDIRWIVGDLDFVSDCGGFTAGEIATAISNLESRVDSDPSMTDQKGILQRYANLRRMYDDADMLNAIAHLYGRESSDMTLDADPTGEWIRTLSIIGAIEHWIDFTGDARILDLEETYATGAPVYYEITVTERADFDLVRQRLLFQNHVHESLDYNLGSVGTDGEISNTLTLLFEFRNVILSQVSGYDANTYRLILNMASIDAIEETGTMTDAEVLAAAERQADLYKRMLSLLQVDITDDEFRLLDTPTTDIIGDIDTAMSFMTADELSRIHISEAEYRTRQKVLYLLDRYYDLDIVITASGLRSVKGIRDSDGDGLPQTQELMESLAELAGLVHSPLNPEGTVINIFTGSTSTISLSGHNTPEEVVDSIFRQELLKHRYPDIMDRIDYWYENAVVPTSGRPALTGDERQRVLNQILANFADGVRTTIHTQRTNLDYISGEKTIIDIEAPDTEESMLRIYDSILRQNEVLAVAPDLMGAGNVIDSWYREGVHDTFDYPTGPDLASPEEIQLAILANAAEGDYTENHTHMYVVNPDTGDTRLIPLFNDENGDGIRQAGEEITGTPEEAADTFRRQLDVLRVRGGVVFKDLLEEWYVLAYGHALPADAEIEVLLQLLGDRAQGVRTAYHLFMDTIDKISGAIERLELTDDNTAELVVDQLQREVDLLNAALTSGFDLMTLLREYYDNVITILPEYSSDGATVRERLLTMLSERAEGIFTTLHTQMRAINKINGEIITLDLNATHTPENALDGIARELALVNAAIAAGENVITMLTNWYNHVIPSLPDYDATGASMSERLLQMLSERSEAIFTMAHTQMNAINKITGEIITLDLNATHTPENALDGIARELALVNAAIAAGENVITMLTNWYNHVIPSLPDYDATGASMSERLLQMLSERSEAIFTMAHTQMNAINKITGEIITLDLNATHTPENALDGIARELALVNAAIAAGENVITMLTNWYNHVIPSLPDYDATGASMSERLLQMLSERSEAIFTMAHTQMNAINKITGEIITLDLNATHTPENALDGIARELALVNAAIAAGENVITMLTNWYNHVIPSLPDYDATGASMSERLLQMLSERSEAIFTMAHTQMNAINKITGEIITLDLNATHT